MVFERGNYFLQVQDRTLLGASQILNGNSGSAFRKRKIPMCETVAAILYQRQLPHVVADGSFDGLLRFCANLQFASEASGHAFYLSVVPVSPEASVRRPGHRQIGDQVLAQSDGPSSPMFHV